MESSGAEGLRWPALFSGVEDLTPVFPGPAVAGFPPVDPEGWTAAWFGVGDGCALLFSSSFLSEDIAHLVRGWSLTGRSQLPR